VGAAGASCKAGYKPKKVLKGLTCDTANASSAADCNTNCCEADEKTCGGVNPTCGVGNYKLTSKATDAEKDAWAGIATTKGTAQTTCCTTKAKCSSSAYTCPPGEVKATAALALATDCMDDAASCAKSPMCCVADRITCAGVNAGNPYDTTSCTGAGYKKPVKLDEGWSAIKLPAGANAQTQKDSCCAQAVTCASTLYSCPAGYKKNKQAGVSTQECPTASPTSCAEKTTGWAVGDKKCCIPDPDTCAAQSLSCVGNSYADSALDHMQATNANKDQNCCSPKATCKVATCPAGQKKKANSDKVVCTTDAASCAATCCEDDATTCGGLGATTGITCAAGFYDESKIFKSSKYTKAQQNAWKSKAATEKTKNTVCCTKKAECSAFSTALAATTTPAAAAAVATTTPAAPARLFSDHKAAVQSSQSSASLVWFAMGGFIGMSVLHFAQKSRQSSRFVAIASEE